MSYAGAVEQGRFRFAFPLALVALALFVVALKTLGERGVFSVPHTYTDAHGTTGTEEQSDATSDWNDEHCIGGGRHDMEQTSVVDSKGHSRIRWDCTRCPYWYLT